jgi:hypothetical protein
MSLPYHMSRNTQYPFFWGAMICSWLGLGNTMQTIDCTKPCYKRHNTMMTSLMMLCVGMDF